MTTDTLRILVPLDGSPEAESALPLVAPLFRARPVHLTLLRVTGLEDPPGEAREYLGRVRDALAVHGIRADVRTEWGDPAEEILWRATPSAFDLVALTTHGRGGLRRLLAGSVAEAVLRRAELPMLINRPGPPPAEWKRFVVALDGSPLAETIVPEALRLAKLFGAELHFAQAAFPPLPLGFDGPVAYVPPPDPAPYLEGFCETAARLGIPAEAVPLEGPAGRELLWYAQDVKAGLICMTTHGRTGLARLALGSTAEHVLRHAPCPVFLRRALPAGVPADVEGR